VTVEVDCGGYGEKIGTKRCIFMPIRVQL